jgi:hypothetical protein
VRDSLKSSDIGHGGALNKPANQSPKLEINFELLDNTPKPKSLQPQQVWGGFAIDFTLEICYYRST